VKDPEPAPNDSEEPRRAGGRESHAAPVSSMHEERVIARPSRVPRADPGIPELARPSRVWRRRRSPGSEWYRIVTSRTAGEVTSW
jgi:hypothetical protein